jgi:hypothetical protein
VDAGLSEDFARINGVRLSPNTVSRHLATCAQACPTWVQTAMFAFEGRVPSDESIQAYLRLLENAGIASLQGVLLYGLARPSQQPAGASLGRLSADQLEAVAFRLREKGLTVRVSL